MSRAVRWWVRTGAIVLIAAALVSVTAGGVGFGTSASRALSVFWVSLVFSFFIGGILATCVPFVEQRIFRRFAPPWNWAVLVVAMAPMAIVGCALATAVLVGLGALPDSYLTAFARSIRIGLIMTVTFGLAVSAYETMRLELRRKSQELESRLRDETEARRAAAEARQLAAESRLASLESRVQPHFLFNTLNSIAALIHDNPTGAEQMTIRLASLLRSSLDAAATTVVPLEQELETVKAYLDIEQVRLGDRLRVRMHMDPRLRAALVPRLALQTLVENSVKYAVASRLAGGSIDVRATLAGATATLSVEDDGPGFAEADVPPDHGLALLRDRLKLTLGDGAHLRIAPRPDNHPGVRVVIELPADEQLTC